MTHLGRPFGTLRSQVQLLVGGLLALLLVSAAGTFIVQRQVTATQAYLRKTLRPAQVAVARLAEAFVVLVFIAGLMLRNSLSRPLTSLVAEVKRVAEGELGHSVDVAGPAELATVAAAVETMRVRIIAQTARAMEMQRQLDLTEESERIAGGLQDLVIRRLSGTGLVLQSGLVAALREILSNIASQPHASEAEIRVNMSNGVLRLRVTDNGQAAADPHTGHPHSKNGLAELAERLGGTCTIGNRPGGGTAIEWVVPSHTAGPDQELAAAPSEQAQLGRAGR